MLADVQGSPSARQTSVARETTHAAYAHQVQLAACLQAGGGLGQGPGALQLPLSNPHRAVVGQDG